MSQNNEVTNLLAEIEEMRKYLMRCNALAERLVPGGGCLEAKLETLVEEKTGEKQYHSAE